MMMIHTVYVLEWLVRLIRPWLVGLDWPTARTVSFLEEKLETCRLQSEPTGASPGGPTCLSDGSLGWAIELGTSLGGPTCLACERSLCTVQVCQHELTSLGGPYVPRLATETTFSGGDDVFLPTPGFSSLE